MRLGAASAVGPCPSAALKMQSRAAIRSRMQMKKRACPTELNTELAKKLREAKRELAVAKSRAQIAAGDAERARMLQAGSPLTPASTGTPVHGAYRVSPEGVHAKADIQAMLAKAAGRPGPSRPSPLQ